MINNIMATVSPEAVDSYAAKAFGNLFGDVADLAQRNGRTGKNIVASGHSLGGLAGNSMATANDMVWNGFFHDAHDVAFASPSQYEKAEKS